MNYSTFLFTLSLIAAQSCASPPKLHNAPNATISDCCCLSHTASSTMSLERMYHIKLFYNRKKGITPEQFNQYWAYNHSALATDFHLRIGVVKYSQYHSTPELRDLIRVPGGPPLLEFDGAAEFWVPNIETFQAMGSDSEYLTRIQPDEANFIDPESFRMVVGVDYIVVEGQTKVEGHGRRF